MTGWIGREIDGRYLVEEVLGQGGMGVVLRARHQYTGAQVALKVIQPALVTNQEIQQRFLAEARAPSAIGHPNIVNVLDAGKAASGELYIAMELLVGRTLRRATGALPPAHLQRVFTELLSALAAAHARGFIHRDLKPENVFLVAPADRVKLLDFGIAKVLDHRTSPLTAAGDLIGTALYMAPEQLTDASMVDRRADLWAVGVMVYEQLSGQLPYRATGLAEWMVELATNDPLPITTHVEVSPDLPPFFARALARDRERRFASADEMIRAIQNLSFATANRAARSRPTQPPALPQPPHPPPIQANHATQATHAQATQVTQATQATRANHASPTPPQAAMSAVPMWTPPPARSGTWLWAVLAVAVVITATIVAIGLTRMKHQQTPSEQPTDRPTGGQESRVELCKRECSSLGSCAPASCVELCANTQGFRACIKSGSCEVADACANFGGVCEETPRGSRSCGDVAARARRCRVGDRGCLCNAVGLLDPARAVVAWELWSCTMKRCQDMDAACARDKCSRAFAACERQ